MLHLTSKSLWINVSGKWITISYKCNLQMSKCELIREENSLVLTWFVTYTSYTTIEWIRSVLIHIIDQKRHVKQDRIETVQTAVRCGKAYRSCSKHPTLWSNHYSYHFYARSDVNNPVHHGATNPGQPAEWAPTGFWQWSPTCFHHPCAKTIQHGEPYQLFIMMTFLKKLVLANIL